MSPPETVHLPDDFMTPTKLEHSHYVVGFAKISVENKIEDADVAGSGTLVRIGERRGILTAAHVIRGLPEKGEFGLVYTSTASPKPLRTTLLAEHCKSTIIRPRGFPIDGPDLGFLELAAPDAGNVEKKKSFLNLTRRQAEVIASPADKAHGIWMIAGFVHEETAFAETQSPVITTKNFYCLFADVAPPREFENGGFDYLDFEVPHGEKSNAPDSWEGASGGGVWHALIKRDDKGGYVVRSMLLSGVAFYQMPVRDGKRVIRCHGPSSIYGALLAEIG